MTLYQAVLRKTVLIQWSPKTLLQTYLTPAHLRTGPNYGCWTRRMPTGMTRRLHLKKEGVPIPAAVPGILMRTAEKTKNFSERKTGPPCWLMKYPG